METYADLRTRYDIRVRDEDLVKGKVGDSYGCMAVRRVAAVIPDAVGIRVDTQSVTFSVPYEGELVKLTYLTPPILQHYVIAFDAGEDLFPFRFRLDNPIVTARLKKAKAIEKAANKRRSTEYQAMEAGATVEEAKAMAAEEYRAAKSAAFEKAHALHEYLVAEGVENPVEKAAEAAGLLPVKPNRKNNNPDPLFATSEQRTGEGKRAPLPRVFKSRRRSYGQRALRINWPTDPVTGDRIKPDVTRLV